MTHNTESEGRPDLAYFRPMSMGFGRIGCRLTNTPCASSPLSKSPWRSVNRRIDDLIVWVPEYSHRD